MHDADMYLIKKHKKNTAADGYALIEYKALSVTSNHINLIARVHADTYNA
jgi:hypothetical protein